ncbi:MAG: metallophosphoesterase [Bdellovibrionaceae bacterium]|nr:metallophosphoesterase [Bdellovibrionales bacterium]MCB9086119.1 metallophosphoesterase [Pseudobdellovibrionaceae bacterium]
MIDTASASDTHCPQPEETYCIFGDLHLIPGKPEDPRLARFFAELELRQRRNERLHLVFNGDTFDFAMATQNGFCSNGSHAVAALDQIEAQFPQFFTALGQVLESKGKVVFISGNHDLELGIPDVQRRIRCLIESQTSRPVENHQVVFSSWFYHPDPSLYIEHGHQYDAENSVRHPLALTAKNGGKQAYPVGTVLTWYFAAHFQDLELILNTNRHFWSQAKQILIRYKLKAPYAYWLFAKGALSCLGQMVKASIFPLKEMDSLEAAFARWSGVDPNWIGRIRDLMKKPTHLSPANAAKRVYDLLLTTKDLRGDLLINDLKRAADRVREITGAQLVVFSHLHTTCEGEGYANTGSFSYPRANNQASFLEVVIRENLPYVNRRFISEF